MSVNNKTDDVLDQSEKSPQHDHDRKEQVAVTVSYLPAPRPYHHSFEGQTTVGTVRTDAMTFFGVRDYKDRDTHEFFLEFEGLRLTNLAETLDQLLGPHRREAHFNLIEQVTQGAGRI
jgi:hypothetical protein